MSLHFVTSAQAEDHVSSSDEARKTEGMIGSGGFVLGTKDKLSASMIDANTLRILEGDLIFCGRQVNITNYEEVTIQNGTPGMNSIALVVLNLKTDPSEVATIKVYEGTETDGDPVMPEYIEGDLNNGDTEAEMPLYAITKTGLSVGDPVAQFDVWVSEKEFRTSIARTLWTGAWSEGKITVPGLNDYRFFWIKVNGSLTPVVAVRYSSAFRGFGGWQNGNNQSFYTLAASVDNETLTMGKFVSMNHSPSSGHGGTYNQTVQEIIGLI